MPVTFSQSLGPAPPGFFFSQVPMPSLSIGSPATGLAQRSTFNSGTSVLSWQGPVGGGPSNGDYTPQTRTLTSSGRITTSSNGQVIEGLNIVGGDATGGSNPILVLHNNVVIRQCFIQYSPAATVTFGDHCIAVSDITTGLVVEDCMIDGNGDAGEGNGIGGWNAGAGNFSNAITGATVRRNQFFRCGQAIHYTLNNISFTENYCGTFSGADADWFECYPNGGSCDHLLVQYNYLAGPDDSVAGSDSGVNFSTSAGLPAGNIGPNITVDSNWFVWNAANTGAFILHELVNDCGGTAGERLEFTFTNNGVFNRDQVPAGGSGFLFGTHSGTATGAGGGLVHDSGNFIMATPTSRTGVPYVGTNGAGRL